MVYRIAALNKPAIYTFCYLKYGSKFSHTLVGDLDEIPAFNVTKYGNVMSVLQQVISERRNKKQRVTTLLLKSFELLKCGKPSIELPKNISFTNMDDGFNESFAIGNIFGNNSRIISRNFQKQQVSKNACGKSIHDSNHWLMVWHHWAWVSVKDVSFFNAHENDMRNKLRQPSPFYLEMKIYYQDVKPRGGKEAIIYISHTRGRLVEN